MTGDLCVSDDTDTVLLDARYRAMLDSEDTQDTEWLYRYIFKEETERQGLCVVRYGGEFFLICCGEFRKAG